MSLKDTLKSTLSIQTLKSLIRFVWAHLIIQASVGCLALTLILTSSGLLFKSTETLVSVIAETASHGAAPEGMINLSRCVDEPALNTNALPNPICSEFAIKAVPVEQAAAESSHTIKTLLAIYYVFGAALGNMIYMLYGVGRSITPRIRHIINREKRARFEEDVRWCIEQIHQQLSEQPYWEDIHTATFSRHNKNHVDYWQQVNQEATQRVTNPPSTLLYKEAYRELNRMALFSVNIMAGALLDCRHNNNLMKQALEDILTITHDQLSVRAPNSLSEHDHILQAIQHCIDLFCQSIGEPPADFIDFADKMNKLRMKNEVVPEQNEHCIKGS